MSITNGFQVLTLGENNAGGGGRLCVYEERNSWNMHVCVAHVHNLQTVAVYLQDPFTVTQLSAKQPCAMVLQQGMTHVLWTCCMKYCLPIIIIIIITLLMLSRCALAPNNNLQLTETRRAMPRSPGCPGHSGVKEITT